MLEATLFGQLTIRLDGKPVELSARPAQTLLAYLLLHPGVAHRRQQLAGLLWPDFLESSARKNLRNAVWQLRKAIGERYLHVDKETVAFEPSAPFALDVATLARETAEADDLIRAVAVYKGDLLPGFFEEWVQLERERLRALFERRMQELLDLLAGAGRWPEVLTWAEHWIALGHVPEPAYRALMNAHAAQGDLAGMAAAYRRCVQALKAELDVAPSSETQDLYDRLARGETPAPRPQAPQERYQRLELLAVGGQGEVYRGRDTATGQPVVIKRLAPALVAKRPESLARFVREGEVLSRLNHPNIVRMLGAFEQGGYHNIVMEYVPGGTLHDLIRRQGPLPLAQALNIALELADALSRAHHLDIIHRDLKPDNVLMADDGTPRLTDFGLAHLAHQPARLTQAGTIVGSPLYMSPEAVRGAELDARSDIWSFGVLLYEMLAGCTPFPGEQPLAVLAHILHEAAPEIGRFRPDVPPPLAGLLQRMLTKEREERSASMRQIAAELEALRAGRPVDAEGFRTEAQGPGPEAPVGRTVGGTSPLQAREQRAPPARAETGLQQAIRFCTAADGAQIAFATVGQGPPLIKASNWLSHLEFEWRSPIWRHWLAGLSRQHTLIRYDERGNGLSDWDVDEISFEAWLRDLEAVVEASGVERFALFGMSRGGPVAIAYAARHPERVSRLVLYGAYARGRLKRDLTPQQQEEQEALIKLVRLGWGQENPAFRQIFTSFFIPGGTMEQYQWFNDLQRVSASPENAARILAASGALDVRGLARQVAAPTLVLHGRSDARIPFEEGRLLATLIPGARFVPLESRNHILLEDEPAWGRFLSEVHQFLRQEA